MFGRIVKAVSLFHAPVTMLITVVIGLVVAHPIYATCTEEYRSSNRIMNCRDLRHLPQILEKDTVHSLLIEDSSLQVLQDNGFVSYTSLLFLRFKNCGIKSITQEAFFGLNDLKTLNMEGNRLTSVPFNIFHDLRALQHLYLSYNPIEELTEFAFLGLPLLETLSLEHCDIKKISPQAFIGLDRLKTLDLSYNRLNTLDSSMLRSLQTIHSLSVLYIFGNQWICDCNLRWLRKWLDGKDQSLILQNEMDMLMCSGPKKLEGRDLMSISINHFACKPTIVPKHYVYNVAARSLVNLSCDVHANPADNLRWYKHGFLLSEETVKGEAVTIDDMIHGKTDIRNITMVHLITHAGINDTGDYRCEVRNFAGEAYATVQLQIKDPKTGSSSSSLLWMNTGTFIAAVVGGGVLLLIILTVSISCAISRKRGKLRKAQSQAASIASDKIYAAKSEIVPSIHEELDPFGFVSPEPPPPPIRSWVRNTAGSRQTASVDPSRSRNGSSPYHEVYWSSATSTPNRSTFRPADSFYSARSERMAQYDAVKARSLPRNSLNSDPIYHIYEAAPFEENLSYV
ncbi:leucine-rich repeat-containing protein 24-like [Lineus longissimus]|uniref:leucine-rich repeat-containing protein 24-like n=1 Tax=Lineus longissimus TaxID=88925 RepID=UPI002B4F69C1